METLGKVAFDAFYQAAKGPIYKIVSYDKMVLDIKVRWEAAAQAVVQALQTEGITNEDAR